MSGREHQENGSVMGSVARAGGDVEVLDTAALRADPRRLRVVGSGEWRLIVPDMLQALIGLYLFSAPSWVRFPAPSNDCKHLKYMRTVLINYREDNFLFAGGHVPHVRRRLNAGNELEDNVSEPDDGNDNADDVFPGVIAADEHANEDVDCLLFQRGSCLNAHNVLCRTGEDWMDRLGKSWTYRRPCR